MNCGVDVAHDGASLLAAWMEGSGAVLVILTISESAPGKFTDEESCSLREEEAQILSDLGGRISYPCDRLIAALGPLRWARRYQS